ncbi:MAG: GIY-YIG nuclease family protein [Bacteroidales bacterium]|nr:GIY-YIG nuclease family protein [Bacteroidales bacterium]
MLYKVYVIYSPVQKRIFTGMTTALGDAMLRHNGDGASDPTNELKSWTLIHMELFTEESEALIRKTFLESADGQAYIKSDILSLFDI